LLYAKIIKAVCHVNTITLFFSNQAKNETFSTDGISLY
jgi:hypothetical protein